MKLHTTYTTLLILSLCIVSCSKEDDSMTKVGDPNSTAANQVNQNSNSGSNTNPGGTNTAPSTSNGKPTAGGGGGNSAPTSGNPHGSGQAYATCSSCHSRVFKNDNWEVITEKDNNKAYSNKALQIAGEIKLDKAQ